MEYKNLDLVLNSDGSVYSRAFENINQYATNYRVRVAFRDTTFYPAKVLLVINNGLQLPTRNMFLSGEKILDSAGFAYLYTLTQYDTHRYQENIYFSINIFDENDTQIATASFEVPMNKASFGKLTPVDISADSSLDSVIKSINETAEGSLIGNIDGKIKDHNMNPNAHESIRNSISEVSNNLNQTKIELTESISNLTEDTKDASRLSSGVISKAILPEDIAYNNKNNNFTTSQTITGDLTINGNIYQRGSSYITESEVVKTKNDFITLREDAKSGLTDGQYAGLEFSKYDGTYDGRIVIDNKGILRVGDKGSEQPLATREEYPIDGAFAKWDASTSKFITDTNVATRDELIGKVDKIVGKGLSTNDYTDVDRDKLGTIAYNAEENVLSDWNSTTGDSYILNKPTSMPNPYGLTVSVNGEILGTYDGTEKKSFDVVLDDFEQVQTDWKETDPSSKEYIKNKPTSLPNPNSLTIVRYEGETSYRGDLEKTLDLRVHPDWNEDSEDSSRYIANKPQPVDNLESTSTVDYLTANQGRILKAAIDRQVSAFAFDTVQEMINTLNTSNKYDYSIGMSLYIRETDTPDFWISDVLGNSREYSGTVNELITTVKTTSQQIGYFLVSKLESEKVDLTDYVVNTRTVNGYALSADIILDSEDVGTYSASQIDGKLNLKLNPENIIAGNNVEVYRAGNDLTISSTSNVDNETIFLNLDSKLNVRAITDGEKILSFEEIYNAITTNWEV